MTAKDIFRWLGVVFLVLLIIAEIVTVSMVAQTLFSGNLGKVIVGIVLIAYILFFSYASSLMAFWVSYWDLVRRVKIFVIIAVICGFLASLALVPFVIGARLGGIFFAIPILFYGASIYRLFKKQGV